VYKVLNKQFPVNELQKDRLLATKGRQAALIASLSREG